MKVFGWIPRSNKKQGTGETGETNREKIYSFCTPGLHPFSYATAFKEKIAFFKKI